MSEKLDSGVLARNFLIAEAKISFDFKNAWKIAAKYHAQAKRLETAIVNFAQCTLWRTFLDEVRTFFDENPDAEF